MLKKEIKRSIIPALISFAFVFAAYIFLCTQSANAYFGIFLTLVYLLQYLIVFWGVSIFQPRVFISPVLAGANALYMLTLQINRNQGSGFGIIIVSWDWLLAVELQLVALLNFIFTFCFITIMIVIRQHKKRKLHSKDSEEIGREEIQCKGD